MTEGWAGPVLHELGSTLQPLVDPSHRIFWPFLVSSLVMALVVGALRARTSGVSAVLKALFSRRILGHRSAIVDYQLAILHGVIRMVGAVPWALSAVVLAGGVVGFMDHWFGVPQAPGLSPLATTILYSLTLFVCWDLSRYVLHRLLHGVPWLWRFHQVHHSAEVLTPITFYRAHPVESLLYELRSILVTGLVTGAAFWLFRTRIEPMQFLGVGAIGFLFNMLGGNLRHSHVWLSWGRPLEHLFISPAQHQLHHSLDPAHHGRNLGAWLAIWDWFFGTLLVAEETPELEFGLEARVRNHAPDDLLDVLVGPLCAMWSQPDPKDTHDSDPQIDPAPALDHT